MRAEYDQLWICCMKVARCIYEDAPYRELEVSIEYLKAQLTRIAPETPREVLARRVVD